MKISTDKMVKMGMLAALSTVLMLLVRFPIIPGAAFLEYEPADVPVLIAGFLYGPLEALIVAAVMALVQAFTVSAGSGWVGFVMHMIATGTLAVVAALIYKRFHNKKGAIAGLICGSLAMTAIMVPANLFFTVRFFNMPYDAVAGLLVPAIIPFNLIKSAVNSILTFAIYKSVGRIFKGMTRLSGK